MTLRVALHHETEYEYDRPVMLSPQSVRLRPAPHSRTPIISYSLEVRPEEHFVHWQQDPFANWIARYTFPKPTRGLRFEVDLLADIVVVNPFDFFLEEYAERWPFAYEPALKVQLAPFLEVPPLGPKLAGLLESVDRSQSSPVDLIVSVNRLIQGTLEYVIRLEPGVQDPETTLGLRRGSCRDFAWLAVHLLRHLGLAARFTSGYSIQLRQDQTSLDGPSGVDVDCADLHAWAEAYLPGAGWVGLDPTCGLLAGEGYIPLASTAEPSSAAPLSGLIEECESTMQVRMKVRRVHETPRSTLPYTQETWNAIDVLGRKVDADLAAGEVRLLMGGEPTFVSIDDMDGPEWTVEAVGPAKRRLSEELLRRVARRFGKGALLHFGQGKWYPGEALPRWALSAVWRTDGEPLWRDPTLLMGDGEFSGAEPGAGRTLRDARRFMGRLAQLLGVDPTCVLAAHEPRESSSKAAEGPGPIAGWVLPLRRDSGRYGDPGSSWTTCRWPIAGGRLVLLPGDSPVGLRLPLEALSREGEADDFPEEQDPFERRFPLPPPGFGPHGRIQMGYGTGSSTGTSTGSGTGSGGIRSDGGSTREPVLQSVALLSPAPPSSTWIRTALVVEARGGVVHVFYPPVARLEHFVELTEAIERTASELEMPVAPEGYLPPEDPRIRIIKITPDPGVIEVNIHPSASWPELVERTHALYEEARLARLGTEKFAIDGRHTGTGGGNHVVLGGPTPAESPILRRPDLLASLVAFWNNHPALSYIFSGAFIGPTSQAPRVDEGRPETLYELAIAMSEVPRAGEHRYAQPWLVDRIFRNLLVDVTGNTHRAEFCIDKLFSPDSTSGRQGLLELRSFEMPPHAQMSLAQALLVRAAVAAFWRRPYEAPLVSWGAALHDRFLLPHWLEEDLRDAMGELAIRGYPVDARWFSPHVEFRFPLLGETHTVGITLELRQAIEPWHVLGEEPGTTGTARYVDSSLERIQVKASGWLPERYVLAANGRRVPLAATGTPGEAVGGVRFRAWQPARCLHPTIGIDSPLVFDLVDSWNGRSVGGFTYHVAHPGGRNYQTTPVNAKEAEARRRARFEPFGHTPGRMDPPPVEPNPLHAVTLDLRRRPSAQASVVGPFLGAMPGAVG